MAHFRGTIHSNRGIASRLGTKKSGLRVSANGWSVGIDVNLSHVDGKDTVTVWLTEGSNGPTTKLLGRFVEGETSK